MTSICCASVRGIVPLAMGIVLTGTMILYSQIVHAQPPSLNLELEKEARLQAQSYYNTVLIKCGDKDHYGVYAPYGGPARNSFAHVHQFRDLEILIASRELTQADRLNGLEWSGSANLGAGAHRVFENGNWRSWSQLVKTRADTLMLFVETRESNALLDDQPIYLTKSHGKWKITHVGNQFKRPSCKEIPTSGN